MRNNGLPTVAAVCAIFCLCVSGGCQNAGAELPKTPPVIPDKIAVSGSSVRALCYVDVDLYNPLNAGDYTLNGIQFFDYVVLCAAQLKKDNNGWYLYLPANMKTVLDNRNKYIRPLQQKGIKVVLSIEGGKDGVSFGSFTEDDDVTLFSQLIKDAIDNYNLDGAEFYDVNGGREGIPFYPDEKTYADADEQLTAWLDGGDAMNNMMYALRKHFGNDENKFIMVREENFGRFLPQNVSGSEGEATFSGTAEQINYCINSYSDSFEPESLQGQIMGEYFIYHYQYAPMLVNFGGSTVIPPLDDPLGNDIEGFSDQFALAGDYALLAYSNLQPVSTQIVDQAAYISITSQTVFGQDVVCTGGDYQKAW